MEIILDNREKNYTVKRTVKVEIEVELVNTTPGKSIEEALENALNSVSVDSNFIYNSTIKKVSVLPGTESESTYDITIEQGQSKLKVNNKTKS